jgi:hypothetical protein
MLREGRFKRRCYVLSRSTKPEPRDYAKATRSPFLGARASLPAMRIRKTPNGRTAFCGQGCPRSQDRHSRDIAAIKGGVIFNSPRRTLSFERKRQSPTRRNAFASVSPMSSVVHWSGLACLIGKSQPLRAAHVAQAAKPASSSGRFAPAAGQHKLPSLFFGARSG